MNRQLKEKLSESISAVLPITILVLVLGLVLVPLEVGHVTMFLMGALLLILGMGLFQLGAEISLTPLGEGIGAAIGKNKKVIFAILTCFIMGIIITIAEPDLQVLANQVPAIPNNVLIWTVALGVGVMFSLAILRILFSWPLSRVLWILYALLIGLSFLVSADFLPVAFDAGGVTTGPITVPFIMALGVGLASIRSDKHANDDSFGLVAICSIGPILAVMILSFLYKPDGGAYATAEIPAVLTLQDAGLTFLRNIPHYAYEVFLSIIPLIGVLVLFQMTSHRYAKRQFIRMLIGFVYTFLGLVLFLTGVNVGFSSVGSTMGNSLAASPFRWLLIPIGMLIGYYIVKAEPAVQVLNRQVEDVTGGTIPKEAMNRVLSIGMAASVGLSMLRVLTGMSLYWIIIPGYLLALILTRFVPPIFVGIAFDSGGVASGPMTTTFLLPLAIGACEGLGGNVMQDAFGAVALVALTPLIAVQIMGLLYSIKAKDAAKLQTAEDLPLVDDEAILDGDEDILDLEEDDELEYTPGEEN